MGAFSLALVTVSPDSAEAGWRRAWRNAPATVYVEPGYAYYGPAYQPYAYPYAYATAYPYGYGCAYNACDPYWGPDYRRGW